MKRKIILTVLCSILALGAFAANAYAILVPQYNDLWDISQVTTVTGVSRILNHGGYYVSNQNNMFGGTSTQVEPTKTLFEDYNVWSGAFHWIEWRTASSVMINNFHIFSSCTPLSERAFKEFRLYAKSGSSWVNVYTLTPALPYGSLVYSGDFPTVNAQYFRAEFDWATHTVWNSGPRIEELDGFYKSTVPEPATLLLFGVSGLGLGAIRRFRKIV